MKIIKVDLPETLTDVEIHIFADEHIGDPNCDIVNLMNRVHYVATNPNAYCILNGDLMDFASRTSIGDIEARSMNIMEQLQTVIDIFKPVKNKILAITSGNHEDRGYRKEGIDVSQVIANTLNCEDKYSHDTAYVFLRFGRTGSSGKYNKRQYTIFVTHGSGGGKKEGAKAIRLADLATICDADIYIHSHTHLPMVIKEGYLRANPVNRTITNCTKLFVNGSSALNYGGYGEAKNYKPNSKDSPVIHLTAEPKSMTAQL